MVGSPIENDVLVYLVCQQIDISTLNHCSQSFDVGVIPDRARRVVVLAQEEARLLISQGLGGRVTPSDLLIFNAAGPIANSLRFADECVRHKILDIVGDLALANCPIVGHVIANRSGHQLNATLVASVIEQSQDSLAARRCA